jgi:hypothetical protein
MFSGSRHKNNGGFFSMRLSHSVRWLLLALLLSAFSIPSRAGVFISVGFAPPALPVYEQPPCPQPGLMWTPGYWAYGDDGYYWVPGTWVPAPYEGALWTPGYWGWSGGLFAFHDGYWGRHVGYYGGVNYGFGYGGIGFVGGEWRGHDFAYNTAVMHVDNRFVHMTFVDRARVERGFVARDSRVAFSGGPGGIHHDPRPEERMAEHEQHIARTSFQQQHEGFARSDRGSYVKFNGGRPAHLAVDRPLGRDQHLQGDPHSEMRSEPRNDQRRDSRPDFRNDSRPAPRSNYQAPNHNDSRPSPGNEPHATPHPAAAPAPRQSAPPPQHQAAPVQHQTAPAGHPAQQSHSEPKEEHKH